MVTVMPGVEVLKVEANTDLGLSVIFKVLKDRGLTGSYSPGDVVGTKLAVGAASHDRAEQILPANEHHASSSTSTEPDGSRSGKCLQRVPMSVGSHSSGQ
ncbi:MAG: hypothetical protein JO268_18720 [Pseudonocardiales bacterium]|nr:hypothetical protein [Pseudonocardiales bacterium]